jgi:hypothetical protein
MIRIDTTKTNMTDRQAAEFMLDILELTNNENSILSDIRLKSLASMASGDQIDKLLGEVEALKSLPVGMENGKIEDCRDNWCTLITGCESK